MLVLIARNCTKPNSDLSVKKNISFYFLWGFGKCNFFSSFGFTNLQYQSIVLYFTGEEYAAFFQMFFQQKILNSFFLETVDSSIVYQKNWKTSYLLSLLWVLSLKNKVFRAKIFPIRLIQKLGVSFDCSKLYKIHFWLLSEKTSRFNFCRVSGGVIFFRVLDLPIININRLSYISQAKGMLYFFKYFFNN